MGDIGNGIPASNKHLHEGVDFSGLKENLFVYWYQGCLEEK